MAVPDTCATCKYFEAEPSGERGFCKGNPPTGNNQHPITAADSVPCQFFSSRFPPPPGSVQ